MKSLLRIVRILLLALIFYNARAANILGLFGCCSNSHHLWNEVIVNSLAERGHTLTIVSVNENKSPRSNVTYIYLEKAYDLLHREITDMGYTFGSSYPGSFENTRFLFTLKMVACKGIFESNGFQDALNLNEKFDLILYDTETGPCLLRLVERYPGVPVVGVTAFKMDPRVLGYVGGHSYPGYIPHILGKHEMPMNLWKRLTNAGTYAYAYFYRKLVSDKYIENMSEKYIPGPQGSQFDLYNRVKMVLINTHPSMDYAQSLPPNVIEVGGLHIKDPKPLPNNIKDFLESAPKGAVLISLGSNLKAEILGRKRLEALINVIKRFPEYNFVWKVEDKGVVEELPMNLLTQKWLPQNDILAHPKLKAFFTHAGGLSMQEAAFHGVPVIAMPFFIDQNNNAYHAQENGIGIVVEFDEINEDLVYRAFFEILNNENYSKNTRELQKKFIDRPIKPLDTALWWIEYVLRNPQTDHLSPYSRYMTYFVSNSIDIVFICLMADGLILFLSVFVFWKNIRKYFKRKLKIKKKILNKNH